jgi:hypothetical protein
MRDYKACAGELGCKRPVLPTYGMCAVHSQRLRNYGTTTAQHPLHPRQRTPYIQAAFSWLKSRIKSRDTSIVQILSEFDSYLRLHSEPTHIGDLSRRRMGAHRRLAGIWSNILKRWPDGHQAALAILSCALGTRLACAHEPGVTRHPAFTRAMQVYAVYSLVRRKNIKSPFTRPRPVLTGRWLAKRLDDAVEPFIRYMCTSTKDRDRAILERVVTRHYEANNVRWETLSSPYLQPNFTRKYPKRGHACPWRGKSAPKKGDRYVSQ